MLALRSTIKLGINWFTAKGGDASTQFVIATFANRSSFAVLTDGEMNMKRTVILAATVAALALSGCHKKDASEAAAASTEAAMAAGQASGAAATASAAASEAATATGSAAAAAGDKAAAAGKVAEQAGDKAEEAGEKAQKAAH